MVRSEVIRPYLEKLLSEMLGQGVTPDESGAYPIRTGTGGYFVSLDDSGAPLVRVWTPLALDVRKSAKLLDLLNQLNVGATGARAFWVDGQVVVATEMVAETLHPQDLHLACGTVGEAAERFGPQLAAQFGGRTLFALPGGAVEEEAPAADTTPAPEEPEVLALPVGAFRSAYRHSGYL
ncbi:MAG: T3SS (YopN, CesT) and YbjN peptide-binding chaperone 1 [Acidimicrobiia bacterium]